MAIRVRDINQSFWHSDTAPYITIRSTYDSAQAYKAHSHSDLSIGIILSGSTRLYTHKEEFILQQGEVIFIEPEKVHACNPIEGKNRSYHMLHLEKAWCCDMLSNLYGYSVTDFICDQSLLIKQEKKEKLIKIVPELINQQDSRTNTSDVEAELFNIIGYCCSPIVDGNRYDKLADKVKKRLIEDITNPPSLIDLSQEFSRPQESLIRVFKRRFGITPKAFLNNHRVEKAKLLLKGGINIVDVANDVGFSDQSQLHRAFVNYNASTPRQYQKSVSIFDNNS